jgi:hypothetical protein
MIPTHPALQAIKWIAAHQIIICIAIPLLPFAEFQGNSGDPGEGTSGYLFVLPGNAGQTGEVRTERGAKVADYLGCFVIRTASNGKECDGAKRKIG